MVTTLTFHKAVNLEIDSSKNTVLMCLSKVDSKEEICINLEPDEIELVITALTIYKKRIQG